MVPTWMDYGGEFTIRSQDQMKKIADHVPSTENVKKKKKDTEEVIYNTKRL